MNATVEKASQLKTNLAAVRAQISASALRSGRNPQDVRLIAVSKTHPAEVLRLAVAAGALDLGENRVQEAAGKIAALDREVARWHLIGHLQANKARQAAQLFDMIHSVDSLSLALRLERICGEEQRLELPVLIQVDLGDEVTKTGIPEGELPALIEAVVGCKHLRLRGLMTIPPYFAEVEAVRPYFRRLRELRDEWQRREAFGVQGGELSMGMSHDFPVAIEEGATMVRVGTAIFGQRYKPV